MSDMHRRNEADVRRKVIVIIVTTMGLTCKEGVRHASMMTAVTRVGRVENKEPHLELVYTWTFPNNICKRVQTVCTVCMA
eukprot:1152400-Pelagomonas_calceolata.AAC.6